QPEEPRCRETPETWSGVLYIISVRNTEVLFTISSSSYDRTEQKIKITMVKSMTNQPLKTVLDDYEKRIRYCKNETLEGELPSFGVPENAHFDGPVETLGAKIAGLGVTVAHYTIAERGFSYFTYHPLGDEGTQCIPITNSIATLD
nr:RecName: Full=Halilectin 3, alpha chain; Short=H-3 [Haliclona caerulea]